MRLEDLIKQNGLASDVGFKESRMHLLRHDLSILVDLIYGEVGTPAQRNAVVRILTQIRAGRRRYGLADQIIGKLAQISPPNTIKGGGPSTTVSQGEVPISRSQLHRAMQSRRMTAGEIVNEIRF